LALVELEDFLLQTMAQAVGIQYLVQLRLLVVVVVRQLIQME
jgi:hypothetical protein